MRSSTNIFCAGQIKLLQQLGKNVMHVSEMHIACPKCHAIYDVPEDKLDSVVALRCSSCHHSWEPRPARPAYNQSGYTSRKQSTAGTGRRPQPGTGFRRASAPPNPPQQDTSSSTTSSVTVSSVTVSSVTVSSNQPNAANIDTPPRPQADAEPAQRPAPFTPPAPEPEPAPFTPPPAPKPEPEPVFVPEATFQPEATFTHEATFEPEARFTPEATFTPETTFDPEPDYVVHLTRAQQSPSLKPFAKQWEPTKQNLFSLLVGSAMLVLILLTAAILMRHGLMKTFPATTGFFKALGIS